MEKLTSNSSNLLLTLQIASSEARDVSAEAVANQMSFLNWVLVLGLLGMYDMWVIVADAAYRYSFVLSLQYET